MKYLKLGLMLPWMLAALPASSNFHLNSYGFGTGGTANSSSTNYSVNGVAGEVAGSSTDGTYRVGAGEAYVKQANVPSVAIANNANWYNKLLVTVLPDNSPTDARFAVAISTDNFATTQYVKSDFTVGSSLVLADYLTYAEWGAGSGATVRGLAPGTVYSVKAKAITGKFTESGFGPVASVATSDPMLAFDIDVSATDTSTSPPYAVNFGDLLPGSVMDAPKRVWVSLETNAESGGKVYVTGTNAGLRSNGASYVIASQTGDLGALSEGYGLQGASSTQTSGGPLALSAPYNGSSNSVGVADHAIRGMFSSSGPVVGGRGSFFLKAKSQALTPSSADYSEILTAIASASF